MNQSLEGRVVVITGAARGIGSALVGAFVREGAKVVALDRSWDADGDDRPNERDLLQLACDIESEADVQKAFERAMERFGGVDVLINNAAMRQRDYFPSDGASGVLETTNEQWERMLRVNVVAQVSLTRVFVQPMLAKRRGHIINISARGTVNYSVSDGVWRMAPHLRWNQPYEASKAAFTSMSYYLADELEASGVAVNLVFPGAIRTTGGDELEIGRRKRGIDLQMGEPEDVAPVVLHLASQKGVEVTGAAFDAVHWNKARAGRRAGKAAG